MRADGPSARFDWAQLELIYVLNSCENLRDTAVFLQKSERV